MMKNPIKIKFIVILILFSTFTFSQVDSLNYYYQKGDYQKAIEFGEKIKTSNTVKDINYALLLNKLATSYSRIENYKKSEEYYLEELDLELKAFGAEHKIIGNTFRNLANIYSASKQLQKAKEYYTKALNIFEKSNGIDSELYANVLTDLAIVHKDLGDYKIAEINYIKANEILLKVVGEKNISYQKSLISLAIFYEENGDLNKADNLFIKSYELQKSNLKNETIFSYYDLLNTIAVRYSNRQDYTKAEKYYKENLEFTEITFGKKSLFYIKCLINFGIILGTQSKYNESIKYFSEANEILKSINLENSPENSTAIEGLANGFSYQAKYQNAEKYYIELTNIKKNIFGIKSSEYINTKLLLAANYQNKGDYNNAEKLLLESSKEVEKLEAYEQLKIFNKIVSFYLELGNTKKAFFFLSKYDELYKSIRSSLGKNDIAHYLTSDLWLSYYTSLQDYRKALEKAFEKIEWNRQNPLFESLKSAYSRDLSELALCYRNLKDIKNEEKYLLEAMDIRKHTLGQNPRNDATLLLSLGLMYQQKNDFVNAEKYFLNAIELADKIDGEFSFYDDLLYFTTSFYFKNSYDSQSVIFLKKIFEVNKEEIYKFLEFLTISEYLWYKSSQSGKLNLPLSFLDYYPTKYPEINIGCYENELLLKNLSLRNQERIKNNILNSNDTVLKQQYEQFIANKRYLTKLEELPIAQRPQTYEQLKTDTENLEKEITRKSSEFAEAKKSLNITWKQIQEKLKPNEVVIDLISYNFYNKKWTDSVMYGAFVIKKDSKFPKFISLFEEKQLTALLAKGTNQAEAINKQYSNLEISNLFLKPLEAELKNVKTIYLTPTGVAYQINFKALPLQNNNTLGETYDIKLMGAAAQMISYKPTSIQENKNMEFVLYGGIDYDKKTTETNGAPNPNDFNDLATRSGIVEFGYLKGTNVEVEKIKELATQNNYSTSIFKEKKATEESIKKLENKSNPFILHLATHGYFFENKKQEIAENSSVIQELPNYNFYKESEDPMLRSGLILAGGNKFWKNTNKEIAGDDGIVTAKEIANLDLSNCQLVVLSACETGLGDLNGSEGVFGLQRAFKMAGVKNIIMSLWKVPDAQTAELFEVFYAECFKGKTIPEAFREAQNKMKTKYEPYYWAGFVLLE